MWSSLLRRTSQQSSSLICRRMPCRNISTTKSTSWCSNSSSTQLISLILTVITQPSISMKDCRVARPLPRHAPLFLAGAHPLKYQTALTLTMTWCVGNPPTDSITCPHLPPQCLHSPTFLLHPGDRTLTYSLHVRAQHVHFVVNSDPLSRFPPPCLTGPWL